MSATGSEHSTAIPVAIPFEPAVPGQPRESEADEVELVSRFEKYDFGGDKEFRAGLPAVIKGAKGRGSTACEIDDVIARAQWFYFTRKEKSTVPFDTYLRLRSGDTESIPMSRSVMSPETSMKPVPLPDTAQGEKSSTRGRTAAAPPPPLPAGAGLQPDGVPDDPPPPFRSTAPTPTPLSPSGVGAGETKPLNAARAALAGEYDDGEGGITVTRACVSQPASRAASPAPSPPSSRTSSRQPSRQPSIHGSMGTPAGAAGGTAGLATTLPAPSTGASGLNTPGLTNDSSAASTPAPHPAAGGGVENRVAVAAEMATPAEPPSDAPAYTESHTPNGPQPPSADAPGPIETVAPGPPGPQMPFDEVVRLISSGKADQVPRETIPDGLNEAPASTSSLAARPKPWEKTPGE